MQGNILNHSYIERKLSLKKNLPKVCKVADIMVYRRQF